MSIEHMDAAALAELERAAAARYDALAAEGLTLDLTRGKPSSEQLDLSSPLDGLLDGEYLASDGTDTRGYGGLDGLPEMKKLAADWLGVRPDETLVGGNSSLNLMYLYLLFAHVHGLRGRDSAWSRQSSPPRFLCPVPGYDRHFAICEELGIEMQPVALTGDGPDMDAVEAAIAGDRSVKGIWCVPRYANPSGETYSDDTVRRIARLALLAGEHFRVMWDDAYAVHHLTDDGDTITNVFDLAREAGTEDSIVAFGSTSKVTFAGAGLAFLAASPANLAEFRERLSLMTIGPDKVNQLRHTRFLPDMDAVGALMHRHAAILGPKFECVERQLTDALGNRGLGTWTTPRGGYFVSFYTRPGLATEVVRLAGEAGVKLTPAGAAFPYGKDPDDSHIRLAPSFPPLAEVESAMRVFTTCVELATVRAAIARAD